uniref:Uncharacterized protein n=1 Tax=Aegilops tauschii subsp. strangulata TaxID=200361 RepID=A0A453AIL2_AEGTS
MKVRKRQLEGHQDCLPRRVSRQIDGGYEGQVQELGEALTANVPRHGRSFSLVDISGTYSRRMYIDYRAANGPKSMIYLALLVVVATLPA